MSNESNAALAPTVVVDDSDASFRFVRELAQALSPGPVQLPSFPDAALRVQELLTDDSVSTEMVVRIVGAEPMLAARIMTVANSAAMNPSGTPITDLRTAVARLGFDSLRASAVSFAMAQLRHRDEYRSVEKQLAVLWLESVTMGATASVVARRCGRVSPDTALFAGLVSGVGRIYILTRAARHPQLFANAATYQEIQRDWHVSIARALLESWYVADEIIEAVQCYEVRNHESRHGAPLPDVLATAEFLNCYRGTPQALAGVFHEARAAARLGLDAPACIQLLKESAGEMTALRAALGH